MRDGEEEQIDMRERQSDVVGQAVMYEGGLQ